MIKRYASTMALRGDYIALDGERNRYGHKDAWYGNETAAETLRRAEVGDVSLVANAEALITKLDTAIETPRRIWSRAPAGAWPCVPDAVRGLPTPMRRLEHQADETTPITILAITTSSAGIAAKTLQERGVVILALVMALTRIRPVSLQQVVILDGKDNGETIITSEINTHPLDLATACYVLTSAGFARRMTYGLAIALNSSGGHWPKAFRYGAPQKYYEYLKQNLAINVKQSLVIGAAQLGDEMLADPVLWINNQIAYFTKGHEEVA